VAYDDLSREEIDGLKKRMRDTGGEFFGASAIPQNSVAVFENALKRKGRIPVVISPDDISIFVAGGVSGYTFGMSYMRGAHQTKKIN
jgi:hypothetical protein